MYSQPLSHLPDPERQAGFYDGVTVKRGFAWVIDLIIISIISLLISTVTVIGLFMIPLIYIVIAFFYRWLSIAGGSATPGMRLMAIELRNAYGERLDTGQALLHTLGYFVTMSTFILQVISVVLMFSSERGQGLSDMVLGTVALNKRA